MAGVLISGELRIVMIGKTGVGKSAVGNSILANKAFSSRASDKSVTTECQRKGMTCDNRLISVVDTPGIIDTHRSESEILKEIAKCINYSCPGPHVFLLIMQIGRFTKEEKNSVKALQKLFGQQADKYMIVLFTRGDDLEENETTIEEYVQNADAALKEVIQRCGGRYHVFNNRSKGRKQVDELIKKIDDMVAENGNHYTNEIYKRASQGLSFMELLVVGVKAFFLALFGN